MEGVLAAIKRARVEDKDPKQKNAPFVGKA